MAGGRIWKLSQYLLPRFLVYDARLRCGLWSSSQRVWRGLRHRETGVNFHLPTNRKQSCCLIILQDYGRTLLES